ncbi:MAG: OmpA family protein [Bacteroidetes bacterium]|nr:OmpA family protein [Bacteroidota bacterium]
MKYRFPGLIFIFIFSFITPTLIAQHQVNKKALKLQELAFIHFKQNDTTNALEFALEAIKRDSLFASSWVLAGNIYEMHEQIELAAHFYRKALDLSTDEFNHLFYALAELEVKLKNFDAAIKYLSKYLSLRIADERERREAEQLKLTAEYRKNAYQNPVEFKPKNLGQKVNSSNDEYVNSLSTDEQSMYLTIKSKVVDVIQNAPAYIENIYQTQLDSINWSDPKIVIFGDQFIDGAGGASVSPNNRYLFFTSCNKADSKGGCDLYYSKIIDGKLSDAKNLGSIVNSGSWDSQPCFSSNGISLFFASKRPGGFGGSDIWISELDKNGNFTNPQNAGSTINTTGDEMAPLIHYDAATLFFSSNGHIGMGGYDLFVSKYSSDGNWSMPENLGYPVNTDRDEINLIVAPDGLTAYISSDQPNGFGGFDIYKFSLNQAVRPNPVTYVKGIVYDAETGEKLNAKVELVKPETGELFTRSESDLETGAFLVALPMDQMISLNVDKKGYLFYSDHFNTHFKGSKADPVEIQIPLKKLKSGEIMVLNNIFFEINKFELMESSFPELNKLEALLSENPSLRVEISGHTDNVGTIDYNNELSKKRAKSVYDYLISKGFEPLMMEYKGFGFTKPIDTNDTESGKSKNRRTEIKIL